jgi:hypothetical protein
MYHHMATHSHLVWYSQCGREIERKFINFNRFCNQKLIILIEPLGPNTRMLNSMNVFMFIVFLIDAKQSKLLSNSVCKQKLSELYVTGFFSYLSHDWCLLNTKDLLDNYLAGNIDVNIIFKVYYEVKYVKFLVNNVSSSFKTVCIKQFGL